MYFPSNHPWMGHTNNSRQYLRKIYDFYVEVQSLHSKHKVIGVVTHRSYWYGIHNNIPGTCKYKI